MYSDPTNVGIFWSAFNEQFLNIKSNKLLNLYLAMNIKKMDWFSILKYK